MEIKTYVGNSDAERKAAASEPKKYSQVAQGSVYTPEKSGMSKLLSIVLADDVHVVASNIFDKAIKPMVKKALYDTIVAAAGIAFCGDPNAPKNLVNNVMNYWTKPNSNGYSAAPSSTSKTVANGTKVSVPYQFNGVTLTNYNDAVQVISTLVDDIREYSIVTVGQLYQMCGIPTSPIDYSYGWKNDLNEAAIVEVANGYWLKMPQVRPINK